MQTDLDRNKPGSKGQPKEPGCKLKGHYSLALRADSAERKEHRPIPAMLSSMLVAQVWIHPRRFIFPSPKIAISMSVMIHITLILEDDIKMT